MESDRYIITIDYEKSDRDWVVINKHTKDHVTQMAPGLDDIEMIHGGGNLSVVEQSYCGDSGYMLATKHLYKIKEELNSFEHDFARIRRVHINDDRPNIMFFLPDQTEAELECELESEAQ